MSAAAVPDLLDALVDKSLLQLSRDSGRYRVLETIREYGLQQLTGRGEADAVRLAAARHAAELATAADPGLRSAEQTVWMDRLRAEHDNVVAALRTFCDLGRADEALRLVLDFGWFWFLQGRYAEAGSWADAVLAVPGGDAELRRSASVLSAINQFEGGLEPAIVAHAVEQCRAVLASGTGRPLVLLFAPLVLQFAGEVELAQQGLSAVIASGDEWLAAAARMMRTRLAENEGDISTVQADVEVALAAFRRLGDRWGIATSLPVVALLRAYDGDLDGALDALREAREVSRVFGSPDPDDQLFLALRTVDLHLRRGDVASAREVLDEARAEVYERSTIEPKIIIDALTSGFYRSVGDLDAAAEAQHRADEGLRTAPENRLLAGHGIAIVNASGAMLDVARGAPVAAADRLTKAHAAGLRSQDRPIQAMVGIAVADLALCSGAPQEALTMLGAAARLRGADDPTAPDLSRIRRAATTLLPDDADARSEVAAALYRVGRELSREEAVERLDPARLRGTGADGLVGELQGDSAAQALLL